MNSNEIDEFVSALARHEVEEVARVYTYSGHIEGRGEVLFRVKDLGRTPRWSIQAFDDAGELLGSDVEDSLSVAVVGVFNKFR